MSKKRTRYRNPYQFRPTRRYKKRRYRLRPLPILICILLLMTVLWACFFQKKEDNQKDSSSQSVQSQSDTSKTDIKSSKKIDKNAWNMILVNQSHPLSSSFAPETKELPNSLTVDARIYEPLMNMINDAKDQGLDLVVCSGYRPYELQERLFQEQIDMEMENGHSKTEAEKLAATTVAIPGTSEHQSGLAVDIVALDYQNLDEGVMETPEVQWLYAHCHEYGFIVRYPDGKSDITKIIYEPWHYRYVGVEAATEIMSQGICLEEYLGQVD